MDLFYIFLFCAVSVTGLNVNYGMKKADDLQSACKVVEVPADGFYTRKGVEMLQNIEVKVKKHLHEKATRECYMNVDTKMNEMWALARTSTVQYGLPCTAVVVFFQVPGASETAVMMLSGCVHLASDLFFCASEVEINNMSEIEAKMKEWSKKTIKKVKWLKLNSNEGVAKNASSGHLADGSCKKVDVPVGKTKNYVAKIKSLEDFGDRQIIGDQFVRECFLEFDTQDWKVKDYVLKMKSDGLEIFYNFSKAGNEDKRVGLFCEGAGGKSTAANCQIERERFSRKSQNNNLPKFMKVKSQDEYSYRNNFFN